MENAKISVIVPVYNVEKYLSKCVDSILSQTYENIELILVDDASPDRSGQICEEYAKKNPKVKTLHVENGGPNHACYEGLKISSGKYICFCDSDDWMEFDMLEAMSRRLTGEKKEIVCCNFIIEEENGAAAVHSHGAAPGVYEGVKLKEEIVDRLLGNADRKVSMSRCMKLYSKELLTENTALWDFKLRMGDDMTIVIPAVADCDRLVIMEGAVYYHYRLLHSSLVHRYDTGLYGNIRYLKEILEKLIEEKKLDKLKGQAVEREYLYLLMLVLKNELRGNKENAIANMKAICRQEQTESKIKKYGLPVNQKAELLCKWMMQHPNYLLLWTAQRLIHRYDRKGK